MDERHIEPAAGGNNARLIAPGGDHVVTLRGERRHIERDLVCGRPNRGKELLRTLEPARHSTVRDGRGALHLPAHLGIQGVQNRWYIAPAKSLIKTENQ